MTVMQRWADVKNGIREEDVRIKKCIKEAMEIIKQNCGQDLLSYHTFRVGNEEDDFYNSQITVSYFNHSPELKIQAGCNSTMYSSAFKLETHWYGTLREYEAIHDMMKTITTGTIMEIWESQQE